MAIQLQLFFMAYIITLGNEKGGSGKTTTAMHLICALLELGFKVGAIDLDSRQQSLTRYLQNRESTIKTKNRDLRMPQFTALTQSANVDKQASIIEDEENFAKAIDAFSSNDFIIIDTPGSDSALSRVAHSYGDTVITPINDSFVDLDLIGNVNAETLDSMKPGVYSAMLWEAKMKRAQRSKQEQDWVIVRNRLSQLDAHNKRNMELALQKLAKRFGFRVVPGFGDRVVFKELFLHGLTLHDAMNSPEIKVNTSVVAARMEMTKFISGLNIAEIVERISKADKAA